MVAEYEYDAAVLTGPRTYVHGTQYIALDVSGGRTPTQSRLATAEMSRGDERAVMRDHVYTSEAYYAEDHYYLPLTRREPLCGFDDEVIGGRCPRRRGKGRLEELYTVAGLADCRGWLEEMYTYDAYGNVTVYNWPPGDINQDGRINAIDYAEVKGWNGDPEPLGDQNLDGCVNTIDYAEVKSWSGEHTDILTHSGLDNPHFFTGRITDTLHAANPADETDLTVEGDPDGFKRIQDNRNRVYDPSHGRWLQRDPLGIRPDAPYGAILVYDQYGDGMSLYLYVRGNPLVGYDPFGLRDWFDKLADFVAGVGDSLSFGITRGIRKAVSWGILDDGFRDEQVRPESGYYIAGETVEVAVEIGVTAGGATLRHVARKTTREVIEGRARDAFRRRALRTGQQLDGMVVHHLRTIKGHPGGRTARYPLPLRFAGQGRWNLKLVTHEKHLAMHRWERRVESLDRLSAPFHKSL